MTHSTARTVEAWASAFVTSTDLATKLSPPPAPKAWEEAPQEIRRVQPGRPSSLVCVDRARKSPTAEALRAPARRAELVHTFLHHELQAAELMAWALLAFPETPRAFRMGLLHVMQDEIRHMALYRAYLVSLGFDFGAFPVRDWFWERVPSCPTPAHFCAVMGIGFEGGNLDHTRRFAERFRAVGDLHGAELQEQVGEEEIAHVRFAVTWFRKWVPDDTFAVWKQHLVASLTPTVMRGVPMNRESRRLSGMSDRFMDDLAGCTL